MNKPIVDVDKIFSVVIEHLKGCGQCTSPDLNCRRKQIIANIEALFINDIDSVLEAYRYIS